jgi:hypothetical protein
MECAMEAVYRDSDPSPPVGSGYGGMWGCLVVFSLVFMGCAHNPSPAAVFSDRWSRDTEAVVAEDKHQEPEGEIVLGGKDGKEQVAVRLDEEGKPRLQLGPKDSRMRLDLRVKHGAPAVKLRYKVKWGSGYGRWPESPGRVEQGRDKLTGDP